MSIATNRSDSLNLIKLGETAKSIFVNSVGSVQKLKKCSLYSLKMIEHFSLRIRLSVMVWVNSANIHKCLFIADILYFWYLGFHIFNKSIAVSKIEHPPSIELARKKCQGKTAYSWEYLKKKVPTSSALRSFPTKYLSTENSNYMTYRSWIISGTVGRLH